MRSTRSARIFQTFQCLLWPPICCACGDRRQDALLCEDCKKRLRRAPSCDVLPAASGLRQPVALWEFDDEAPIRPVLHRLKYGASPWIGRYLGRTVANSDLHLLDEPWDCVVPIPLHRRRFLERGYNQSEWIARGLAEVLEVPMHKKALVRTRDTPTQTSLARPLRHANVLDAFRISSASDLFGVRVLLIDDTLTTGATLESAGHVLLAAGAQCVQPVAVARAALRLEKEQGEPASVIGSRTSPFADESSVVSYNL